MKMRSVTEQGALDEFLSTAELADTDFTAEKMDNVKVIHTDQKNPYLLTSSEEKNILNKQKAHRGRLTVPRRPKWDSTTTPERLDALERGSFLDWRRGLADLQENQDLLMTPFERNLEVWRQLWRVVERSDLVVQIVDARSPLLFRSDDLDNYVKDIDPKKENLLLINKADMLTVKQRQAWAKYLKEAGIPFKFFSAFLAKESNEREESDEEDDDDYDDYSDKGKQTERIIIEGEEEAEITNETASEEEDEDIRIITVQELEALFLEHAPTTAEGKSSRSQIQRVVDANTFWQTQTGSSRSALSATPTSESHLRSTPLSVPPRCLCRQPPERRSTSRRSTSATRWCSAIAPVWCSPTSPPPRRTWCATASCPSTR